MTTNEAVEQIKKLLNMTVDRGATPAEAAAAAAHVRRLLLTHQLSLLDVECRNYDDTCIQDSVELPMTRRIPAWVHSLANAVAKPMECDYLVSKSNHQNAAVIFIGFSADVQVVAYLWTYLSTTLQKQADDEGRRAMRRHAQLISFRNTFMRGAARAIYRRLEEDKRRDEAADSRCRALVLVKKPQVEAAFARMYPDVKTVKSARATDAYAYARGERAGEIIPINKAVAEAAPEAQRPVLALGAPQ